MNDRHEIERRIVINQENPLLHNRIEELTVSNSCCNGKEWRVLDLSLMSELQELKVGDHCFEHVMTVKLIGLKRLKSVVVGNESFYRMKNEAFYDPSRHFYLKNCPSILELKMGRYAFADYCVCEIEDNPRLEVIEMGELYQWSENFKYALKLELKSESREKESGIDLPMLKSLLFAGEAFCYCYSVVFESEETQWRVMNRLAATSLSSRK